MIFAVNAIFALPTALVNHVYRTQPQGGMVLWALYTFTVGFLPGIASLSLMAGAAQGQPRGLQVILFDGWQNLWRVAWTEIRVLFRIVLYMLLFFVPGLISWTACWVATPAAYLELGDPVARSKALTEGQRWNILALGGLGLVLTVLPVILMNIVIVRTFGKEGGDIIIGTAVAFLGLVGWSFRGALALATYYGLRNAFTGVVISTSEEPSEPAARSA